MDRYQAYNMAPCRLQYCYTHLLREVQDLDKESSDGPEVKSFVETFPPLLSQAMSLRGLPISDRHLYRNAKTTEQAILKVVEHSACHPSIQRIQDIFPPNPERTYRWAEDPDAPAENNFAESGLRRDVPWSSPAWSALALNPMRVHEPAKSS